MCDFCFLSEGYLSLCHVIFIAHLFYPWRQWLYSFNKNEWGMGGGGGREIWTFLWCFPMGVVILLFLWPPEIVWQRAVRSGEQDAEEVTAVGGSAATVYGNGAQRRAGDGSLQRATKKEANRQSSTSTTSGKRCHTPTSPPPALQGTTGPDVSLEHLATLDSATERKKTRCMSWALDTLGSATRNTKTRCKSWALHSFRQHYKEQQDQM